MAAYREYQKGKDKDRSSARYACELDNDQGHWVRGRSAPDGAVEYWSEYPCPEPDSEPLPVASAHHISPGSGIEVSSTSISYSGDFNTLSSAIPNENPMDSFAEQVSSMSLGSATTARYGELQGNSGGETSISSIALDSGFRTIEQPSRFFKTGRVFKVLWTEPAGNLSDEDEGKFVANLNSGQKVFTKVRRFVVARSMPGHSLCIPLNTYHRQATTKPGVRSQDYAAVYPFGGTPEYKPGEQLDKEPFPILVERLGEQIDLMSRLNFARVYTVEHNIRVQKVGRIPNGSLPRLNEYFVKTIAGSQEESPEVGPVGTAEMPIQSASPSPSAANPYLPQHTSLSSFGNDGIPSHNWGMDSLSIAENFALASSTPSSYSVPEPSSTVPRDQITCSAPDSGMYEEVDHRFRLIDGKAQKSFWKLGRVFMVLWTEPTRTESESRSGNSSFISNVSKSEKVYTEIRRFVVIQQGYGNSICSPINTYSGQATLKPNLPEPHQHAIIYTGSRPPEEQWFYAADGTVVRENLSKDPIRVINENSGPEGVLNAASRINYSKIYTVENYVRVLNIGIVHPRSMDSLIADSFVRRDGPPQGPREGASKARSRITRTMGKQTKRTRTDKDSFK